MSIFLKNGMFAGIRWKYHRLTAQCWRSEEEYRTRTTPC